MDEEVPVSIELDKPAGILTSIRDDAAKSLPKVFSGNRCPEVGVHQTEELHDELTARVDLKQQRIYVGQKTVSDVIVHLEYVALFLSGELVLFFVLFDHREKLLRTGVDPVEYSGQYAQPRRDVVSKVAHRLRVFGGLTLTLCFMDSVPYAEEPGVASQVGKM